MDTVEELQDVLKMEREAKMVLQGRVNELQRERDEWRTKFKTFESSSSSLLAHTQRDHESAMLERDHFKASYARKLVEHSETLNNAMQLCKERDEALAKLAATEAHCATLRAALEGVVSMYSTPRTAIGAGARLQQFLAAKEALAATPADSLAQVREQVRAEILPVVQEAAAGLDPEAVALINEGGMLLRAKIRREAIREWCEAIQDDAITSWLDHTPEPLGPGDLLKRLLWWAGKERAVRELKGLIDLAKQQWYTVKLSADPADCSTRDALVLVVESVEKRADEIAKEGK